jgi:leucyl-tRNA synthetase
LEAERGLLEGEVKERALKLSEVKKWVLDKKIVKVIYVPERLINLVLDTS